MTPTPNLQVGVHAPLSALRVVVTWTDWHGASGGVVPAATLRCINAPNGSAQALEGVAVAAGHVQPLWFGWAVPADASPGQYTSTLRVRDLEHGVSEEVSVRVQVMVRAPAEATQ